MSELSFEDARGQFTALQEKTFLDAACVSLAPKVAAEAITAFLQTAQQCRARSATANHIVMDGLRTAARPLAAAMIGAAESEIALVESTSHGLTIAAQSIPLEKGDRVLVADLEFMQVAVPWCQLRERAGIAIDGVPQREGRILVDDIAAAIGPKTRVLCLSSVQWSNGFRCDLDKISKLCRDAGVWLVVDAVQQLGAFPIDVTKTPVDFLACGGHKWLNAPFGAGFLYIRRGAMEKLRPPLAGYLSLETPEGGWGNYFQTPSITPVRDYRFVDAARRFEIGGTANYPGAVGLAASLGLVAALGQDRIAARITALTGRLLAGRERRRRPRLLPLLQLRGRHRRPARRARRPSSALIQSRPASLGVLASFVLASPPSAFAPASPHASLSCSERVLTRQVPTSFPPRSVLVLVRSHVSLLRQSAFFVQPSEQTPPLRYIPSAQPVHWFAAGPEHDVQLASHGLGGRAATMAGISSTRTNVKPSSFSSGTSSLTMSGVLPVGVAPLSESCISEMPFPTLRNWFMLSSCGFARIRRCTSRDKCREPRGAQGGARTRGPAGDHGPCRSARPRA